jgi:hypothetical protein
VSGRPQPGRRSSRPPWTTFPQPTAGPSDLATAPAPTERSRASSHRRARAA